MRRMKTRYWLVVSAAAALLILFAQAQQPAASGRAKAGVTPKGITWPSPALPAGQIAFDTGIERGLHLTILKGLVQPWSMAFLPSGEILVTELPGRLRIVRNGVLDPAPIAGTPQVQAQGLGVLEDLALHPRFAENGFVYFTYHKPPPPTNGKSVGSGVITLGLMPPT